MNEYKKDILKRSKMWLVAAIVLLLCWMICEFIKEESILSLFLMFMSLFCSIVFAVHMILIIVPVMSAFIGKLIGKLIRKKSQLTIEDLKKDKDYYREILLNNSPLILGYLDNLELEKKDIIAEILFLKIENIIEISDGKIEKAENYHTAKLKPTQKQILEKILYGKLRIKESFLLELREAISHEAENLFLIKKKEKISKKNDIIAETFAKFGAICAFLLLVLAFV